MTEAFYGLTKRLLFCNQCNYPTSGLVPLVEFKHNEDEVMENIGFDCDTATLFAFLHNKGVRTVAYLHARTLDRRRACW